MSKDVDITDAGGQETFTTIDTIGVRTGGGSDLWLPEDDTRVAEITIRANGDYVPVDDNVVGYAKVNVMVAGGGAAEYDTDKTFAGDDSEAEIWPLDQSQWPKAKPKRWKVPPASVGGIIRGIDKETGDMVTVTVRDSYGVPTLDIATDEANGKPTSIIVLVGPNKTSYKANQTIDYTGMVLGLVRSDGNLFSSKDYPDGTIRYRQDGEGPSEEHPKRNYVILTPTTKFTQAGYVSVKWVSPYDETTYSTLLRLAAK